MKYGLKIEARRENCTFSNTNILPFSVSCVFCFPLLFVSELGLLMKSCIDQGQLVPDDVMSRLILNDLRAIDGGSWLLDGKFSQLCISTWFIW